MKMMSQLMMVCALSLMMVASGERARADDEPGTATSGGVSESSSPEAAPVVKKKTRKKKKSDRMFCIEGERRTRNGCEPDLGRGLASLPPARDSRVSQGEQMLSDVRSSQPRFMGQTHTSDGAVRLTGVCHDVDGVVYYSGQKGYSDCLDSRTAGSGNVSDYFSAYRQAGVGVQIGN